MSRANPSTTTPPTPKSNVWPNARTSNHVAPTAITITLPSARAKTVKTPIATPR